VASSVGRANALFRVSIEEHTVAVVAVAPIALGCFRRGDVVRNYKVETGRPVTTWSVSRANALDVVAVEKQPFTLLTEAPFPLGRPGWGNVVGNVEVESDGIVGTLNRANALVGIAPIEHSKALPAEPPMFLPLRSSRSEMPTECCCSHCQGKGLERVPPRKKRHLSYSLRLVNTQVVL